MARLLYCSIKEIYQANGEYYTTGSWPEFIPSLASFFDETYLMVTILRTTPQGLTKLSKFKGNEKLRFTPAKNAPFRRMLPFWSLANLNLFRNLQKKADVTLMAIPFSIPYLAYLLLKNKPLVAYVAGDEQEAAKASNPSLVMKTAAKLAEKYLLKKSDVITCPSSRLKKKLVDRYQLLESQIYVIAPPGVKADFFMPLNLKQKRQIRSSLKLDNSLVIGFAAQAISIAKGGDTIIKVFSEIKKEMPNVKLLLIGEDNIGIPNDDSIIHCGFAKREEMPAYYNAMDVFVCASRSETGPKVVMEAAACSIPVISTDVGLVAGLASEGEGALIVDEEDVDGMVNYCRLLLEDRRLRLEMGRKAREYALKEFDSDELVKKTAEVIRNIVVRK